MVSVLVGGKFFVVSFNFGGMGQGWQVFATGRLGCRIRLLLVSATSNFTVFLFNAFSVLNECKTFVHNHYVTELQFCYE